MVDSVKKYFSPRLLDYIVIVGSRAASASQSVQIPELLRRYPPEDHKDFPLPPDVVYFCQPEGCMTSNNRRLPSARDTNSFVFALTEKDTSRVRYGICINYYRKLEMRSSLSSSKSGNSEDDVTRKDEGEGGEGGEAKQQQQHRCLSLVSLCIISHHPFFSTFRECLTILKRMIAMYSDLHRADTKQKYKRDLIWTMLTTRVKNEVMRTLPEAVVDDVCQIETWCLRLLSAPVPVPGKTKVVVSCVCRVLLYVCIHIHLHQQLPILPPDLREPLIFALPDHTRFSLVDFPLHLPLELLGVETCIRVLMMILMEHKVVLQSRDYNALSMSVMAFVTIIYPLEYMFPVIPLLPTCMNSAEQVS